jgi:hypothetical protein
VAGYKYALPGPPFNFLGHMSQTQFGNLQTWVNARTGKFPPIQSNGQAGIQLHYQIRAQQLRKMAGVLEQFAGTLNDQKLTTAFQKEAWQPGPYGHFNYAYRQDHIPMVTATYLKTYMKPQFQRDDELWFSMNHVRTVIEKNEDQAQFANDAVTTTQPPANTFQLPTVAALLNSISNYFATNQYEAVLVNDQTTYGGDPYFRVHQFDPPTQWELERFNHSTPQTPILIKEPATVNT